MGSFNTGFLGSFPVSSSLNAQLRPSSISRLIGGEKRPIVTFYYNGLYIGATFWIRTGDLLITNVPGITSPGKPSSPSWL